MEPRAASLVKLLISGARWCIKAKHANTLECGHHRLRAVTVYPGFLEPIPIQHDLPIFITVLNKITELYVVDITQQITPKTAKVYYLNVAITMHKF